MNLTGLSVSTAGSRARLATWYLFQDPEAPLGAPQLLECHVAAASCSHSEPALVHYETPALYQQYALREDLERVLDLQLSPEGCQVSLSGTERSLSFRWKAVPDFNTGWVESLLTKNRPPQAPGFSPRDKAAKFSVFS